MTDEHFGSCLRRAREERSLSLGDVSASTKVPRSALELLESGSLSRTSRPRLRSRLHSVLRQGGRDQRRSAAHPVRSRRERGNRGGAHEVDQPGRRSGARRRTEPLVPDDEDTGRRRGLGLAVFVLILVLIATITLSLLLRRPPQSGEGLSWLGSAPNGRGGSRRPSRGLVRFRPDRYLAPTGCRCASAGYDAEVASARNPRDRAPRRQLRRIGSHRDAVRPRYRRALGAGARRAQEPASVCRRARVVRASARHAARTTGRRAFDLRAVRPTVRSRGARERRGADGPRRLRRRAGHEALRATPGRAGCLRHSGSFLELLDATGPAPSVCGCSSSACSGRARVRPRGRDLRRLRRRSVRRPADRRSSLPLGSRPGRRCVPGLRARRAAASRRPCARRWSGWRAPLWPRRPLCRCRPTSIEIAARRCWRS